MIRWLLFLALTMDLGKNPIVGILLMQIGNKKSRSHSLTEERNNLRNDASIISNSPAICIICKIAIRHYAA